MKTLSLIVPIVYSADNFLLVKRETDPHEVALEFLQFQPRRGESSFDTLNRGLEDEIERKRGIHLEFGEAQLTGYIAERRVPSGERRLLFQGYDQSVSTYFAVPLIGEPVDLTRRNGYELIWVPKEEAKGKLRTELEEDFSQVIEFMAEPET